MARVVVDVMLKPEILDPQGRAVMGAFARLGVHGVADTGEDTGERASGTLASMRAKGRSSGTCRSTRASGCTRAPSASAAAKRRRWGNTASSKRRNHRSAQGRL